MKIADTRSQDEIDKDDHCATTARFARDAYVRRHMGDVPPIYCQLMPYTNETAALRRHERMARLQMFHDSTYFKGRETAEHFLTPDVLGPQVMFLDDSTLTNDERMQMAVEKLHTGLATNQSLETDNTINTEGDE